MSSDFDEMVSLQRQAESQKLAQRFIPADPDWDWREKAGEVVPTDTRHIVALFEDADAGIVDRYGSCNKSVTYLPHVNSITQPGTCTLCGNKLSKG